MKLHALLMFLCPLALMAAAQQSAIIAVGAEGETEEQFAQRMAQDLEELIIREGPDTIAAFIAEHRPLEEEYRLEDAPFWTESQAQLLRETIVEDADWAEVVDHLDASMHKTH